MTRLTWDQVGQRFYETGVDHGVLYIPNSGGGYVNGYAWNGLVTVTESPSGADSSPQYADNIKYLNLVSAEQFGATIDAFTYPDEFAQCDGTANPGTGIAVGQQSRKVFGLSYRTQIGNDLDGSDHGYKIHLIYGAQAAPSQKAYGTINDSPAALTFSWTLSTTPVDVTGLKPTASITVDSTKVNAASLVVLQDALYGTAGTAPRLPLPDEVIAMFAGTVTAVTPVAPTATSGGVITIPTVTGVTYRRADTNAIVTGTVTLTTIGQSLVILAQPASGAYSFTPNSDGDYSFTKTT